MQYRAAVCTGQGEDLVDEHRRPGAGFGEGDRVTGCSASSRACTRA